MSNKKDNDNFRKPPIPYSRKEPTKKQRMNRTMKKHDRDKNKHRWDDDE